MKNDPPAQSSKQRAGHVPAHAHGDHRPDHLRDEGMDMRRKGDMPPVKQKAAGFRNSVIRIPGRGKAAALAILLHAALLFLGFRLGGAMSAAQVRNLPRFISVRLEHWPSGEEAGKQNQVQPGKSALPPGTATGKDGVSASIRAAKKISEENPARDSDGLGEEGTRLAEPAQGGGSLLSPAAAPGQGSGTAAGTNQGLPSEVLAHPLYAMNQPPLYPRLARRLGKQGAVLLEVFVSAAGMVEEVKVATGSGHEILDEAALDTVRGWRFTPGLRNGRPAAMWVRVPVRFELRG